VADFLARWLDDVVRPVRSPRTEGREALLRLYTRLLDTGLAPKTVRNAHGVLSSALEQAVAWRLVAQNVARQARPPRHERPEPRILAPDEVRLLWAAAGGTRWQPLIILAACTGLRQGEVLGLRWGDIDFAAATLTVRRQLNRDKTFGLPKRRSQRTLDLAEPELTVLREHRTRQAAVSDALGPGWEANDLIFCTDRGRPLNWRNVSREFQRFVAAARRGSVRFHDLRHTNATIMAAAGVPMKVIQERLGHSDIRTTLGFYGHVTPAMGQDAARKLAQILHRDDP
jgi:integrase